MIVFVLGILIHLELYAIDAAGDLLAASPTRGHAMRVEHPAPGTVIGEDHDADRERGFRVTDTGITLVTPDMLGQKLHHTR